MSSGLDGPAAEQARRMEAQRWRERPENEVPVTLPLDAVLAEDEDTCVYLSGCRVFSTGVDLGVTAVARHSPSHIAGLGTLLHGRDPDGMALLLGVEYADGRSATTGDWRALTDPTADLSAPNLWPGGGGGGTRYIETSYFLSPLPPAGPLRLVCAWPGRQLPETVTELSADLILTTAPLVRELWPWEPELPPASPTRPAVPRGGWFSRHHPEPPPPD